MSFNLGTSDCTEAACPCTNASCSFSILIWVWIAPNHSLFHFLKVDLVDWFFWTNRKGADTLTLIFQAPATTGLPFSSLFQQLSKRKGFGPAPIARLDIINNGAWSDEGRGRFRIKAQGKRVVHSPFANPFSRRSRICWLPLLPLHHRKHGLVLPTSTNPWFILNWYNPSLEEDTTGLPPHFSCWPDTALKCLWCTPSLEAGLIVMYRCDVFCHLWQVWFPNSWISLSWGLCTRSSRALCPLRFGFWILESTCPATFMPLIEGFMPFAKIVGPPNALRFSDSPLRLFLNFTTYNFLNILIIYILKIA